MFLQLKNLLNNAFSNINLVMGYYYMSDAEIVQPVNSHRHHRSKRSKSKPETKIVKGGGIDISFFLSIGSIIGLVAFSIFMINELWSIKKANKGIVQIKTNLMAIQQKVMGQEQNFAKLIQTLTSKTKKQEVVDKKEEEVVEEEDSEEEDEDEED